MELINEYRGLIEKIVVNNKKFKGNEDLFEDFCSETFKKAYIIMCSLKNVENIEGYLKKVSSTAILEVLKNSGRLRRTKTGYQKIQQIPIETYESQPIIVKENPYNSPFDVIDTTLPFEEKISEEESLNNITRILIKLNEEEPNEKYVEIFKLKYIHDKKQKEIAETIGISQSEVSKRLVKLTKKIQSLYNYQR